MDYDGNGNGENEDTIDVTVSGLGGRQQYSVPRESTVGDLIALGYIGEGVTVKQAGQEVSNSTDLIDGGHYVTTPPAAKHG